MSEGIKRIRNRLPYFIRNLFFCVLSCFLCSLAVNWIALPNGFPVTGFTGIGMVVQSHTGINYAIIYYLISIIIVVATYFVLGRMELASILFLSVLYPAVLWVMSHIQVELVMPEKLLASIIFGLFYGGGTGLVLRVGYSYGGMDTLAKILRKKFFPDLELSRLMIFSDGFIMLLMLTTFPYDSVAYAFVGQLVTMGVMNYVLFMGTELYEVQIVADHSDKIRTYMIESLHKTMTTHSVTGAYSKTGKVQMDCVCTKREFAMLREYLILEDIPCFLKVVKLEHVFGSNKDFEKLSD